MIKIKEKDDTKIISSSVTDFSDALGYCEHKIPFYIEGIKAPPSLETLKGTVSHEEEEEYEKEHFEFVPITEEELRDTTKSVEFARETLYTRCLVPFQINEQDVQVLLNGRSDKIFRKDETLVVQDDKFPTNLEKYGERFEPFPDQILQAMCYLNSMYSTVGYESDDWFEIPHKEKIWMIQIRDRQNNNKIFKIFKGRQNKDAFIFLHNNLERYAKLILGLEERNHHDIAAKCKPCRYKDQCEFSLV